MKYLCDSCGYIYYETVGDIKSGIKPGTKWKDVPSDYVCPMCKVGKEMFIPA